jgi:hypothetical protein
MAKTREEIIIEIILEVTNGIFTEIGSVGDLWDNAQKAGLLESIIARLDELGITLEDIFPVAVAEAYGTGMSAGNAMLVEAGLAGGALVATVPSKRIHVEALDVLISEGMGDLKGAINTIKESFPEKLEKILGDVQKELGKTIITGENRKKATARVSQVLAKEGLTCFTVEDKNGNTRNLPLDFYASTVTKTKLRSAHNQGSENRYRENGVDLVRVDEHFPTCKQCASKQGIVISLTGDTPGYPTKDEVDLPPYHPNCRHTIRPYILKFKTPEEIERDKKKKYEPEKDDRTEAQKKAYQKEQAIRRKANEEKKDYEAIKAVLGDKAPKTLGAFRRMRRKKDLGWQGLQKSYREALNTMDEEREA